MPSFQSLVIDQFKTLPIVPTPRDCEGKTYVVTGANTGLGFECAKHLVQLSAARVILGVRSLSKGDAAKSKIESETGRKGVLDVWALDLSSFDSVKEFGEKVMGLDRVDAVIENAGVALDQWTVAEGLETTLTVNVVGTLLLGALVLPKLQETAKQFGTAPTLVFVGSGVALDAKGELEKVGEGDILERLNQGIMGNRYPVSKLLLLYAVRQFALLNPVSDTNVTINYLDPGLCVTELSRNVGFGMRLIIRIMQILLARTAEEGSRTLLHAAFVGKDSHGKFVASCDIKEDQTVEPWIKNEAGGKMQRRVWDSVSSRLNAVQPGLV